MQVRESCGHGCGESKDPDVGLGPFVCVRQSSLRGFKIGVRVVPVGGVPQGMWLVAETMAVGATAALAAPNVVARERNVP